MNSLDEKNALREKFNDAYNRWASEQKTPEKTHTLNAFSASIRKLKECGLAASLEFTDPTNAQKGKLTLGRFCYFTHALGDAVYVANDQYWSGLSRYEFHIQSPKKFEGWAINILAFDRVQQEIAAEVAIAPKPSVDTRVKTPLIPKQARP